MKSKYLQKHEKNICETHWNVLMKLSVHGNFWVYFIQSVEHVKKLKAYNLLSLLISYNLAYKYHTGLFFFFFLLHHVACGILVSWPGIKPVHPAVEALRPNHWNARESLSWPF